MGWQPASAVIYDCDTCEDESGLQPPDKLPSGWKQEGDDIICKKCLDKRPCEHHKTVPKIECDICQGKRCPDCLLQLDQEGYWYDGGGWHGPRRLWSVTGHLSTCQWIRKKYPEFFKDEKNE